MDLRAIIMLTHDHNLVIHDRDQLLGCEHCMRTLSADRGITMPLNSSQRSTVQSSRATVVGNSTTRSARKTDRYTRLYSIMTLFSLSVFAHFCSDSELISVCANKRTRRSVK